MKAPVWLRKLIRPFVPERLMTRLRLHEYSRQVRVNIDVVVDDEAAARRWLDATPDTYRVRPSASFGPTPDFETATIPLPKDYMPVGEVVVLAGADTPRHVTERAARPLGAPGIAAAAVAQARPPHLGSRRTEPRVAPVAVAVRREAWIESGGPPNGAWTLPGLWDRLRATGRPLGLVPVPGEGAPVDRTDPIAAKGVIILGVVPMHDVGGGSRAAQVALELVRRGYHVTHVALHGTAESVDLGIRFIHPHLEQIRADELDVDRYVGRLRPDERLAIVEVPAARYLDPARRLRAAGFHVVYDLIDDWTSPALGGRWYRPEEEQAMVEAADSLTASAPDLAAKLAGTGRQVTVVPNAVDTTTFTGDPGAPPPDLPMGERTLLGYHGSLYGEWFDWESLADVAGMAGVHVVLIGDPPERHPPLPPNVTFLGLKPRHELPAYVSRFDVGLVPFEISEVTHSVSPLKVFEYLAMGVPVAAPPLRTLEGLDGVYTAERLILAVEGALTAPRPDPAPVLSHHSWGARLEDLFAAAGRHLAPIREDGAEIVLRPVVHYRRDERRP